VSIAAISAALSHSGVCAAQGEPGQVSPARINTEPDDAPAAAKNWYGWQTFVNDGVAAGLFLSGVEAHNNTTLLGVSGLTFVVGGPVVHLTHGQWEMAFVSVWVRALAPFFGAVLGSRGDSSVCSSDSSCANNSTKWTNTGIAIGGVAASVLDGLVLANDTRRTTPATPSPSPHWSNVGAFPRLIVVPHGAAIGLAGAF
jgi:hypothetical protein